MASCKHLATAALHPPRPTDAVYREDCTLCFDSIDEPAGLDVCLHCFNGGCAGPRHHASDHAAQASHPLALNIKRTPKRKHREEPPNKISKIAIAAETEQDRYETRSYVTCFECGVENVGEVDGKVAEVVGGVLTASTFARQEEVKAWEQEMVACEHTLCLQQEAPRGIQPGDLGHCSTCTLKENLWLCLTCGNLGCGRAQFAGFGGNSHGLAHTDSTAHPVAVKLGSLTADGSADIYCYSCNEERTDPELVAHLAHWGIDIAGRQKTEQSLTEMQVEQNMRWEFDMRDEDKNMLKPQFGPGHTGLKNLGNSCYLAAIMQALFAVPQFAARYYRPEEAIPYTPKPAEDLEIQLRKLADGLLSGRYSKPISDSIASEAIPETPHQKGLAPAMLKHLIGRGHPEFSTMRQQDAFELLLHLFKLITRSQQVAKRAYKDISDPVDTFRFVLEQRLQCNHCKRVRYRQDEQDNISVDVPIERIPTEKQTNKVEDEFYSEFKHVALEDCIANFTAEEDVELDCPACARKLFTKQTRFKTFPAVLVVNVRRFELVNWVPTKADVRITLPNPDLMDFSLFKSHGRLPQEELLPDEPSASAAVPTFVPNAAALAMLQDMGFPRPRCEKALHATGNADAEQASLWLFEHMDDPDIDAPLLLSGPATAAEQDPEQVELLATMGFGVPQARQALAECGGDAERAVDWLFNHPEAQGVVEGEGENIAATDDKSTLADAVDRAPAVYDVGAVVCHKGSSIHAGHYVAMVHRRDAQHGTWLLFNDEKVAEGGQAEYLVKDSYVYFLRREGSETAVGGGS